MSTTEREDSEAVATLTSSRVNLPGLLSFFRSLPHPGLIVFAMSLVLLVAELDVATGDLIGVTYLYLVPVLIIACSANSRSTLAVIASTVFAELAVDYYLGRRVVVGTAIGVVGRAVVECLVAALVLELQALVDQQTRLAHTDPLTGLSNRRVFFAAANREIARLTRTQRSLAILYLDLDGFKQLNDEFGHAEGDALLVGFAEQLRAATRVTDVVARLGGDEFAILLPEADRDAVEALARRIEQAPAVTGRHAAVGVSIGVVSYHPPFPNIDTMLAEAEWLMYKSKRRSAHERSPARASVHWDGEEAVLDLRGDRREIDIRTSVSDVGTTRQT